LEKSHERLPERRVGDSQARNDRVNTCAPLRLRRNDASARAALDDARELDIVVGIVGAIVGVVVVVNSLPDRTNNRQDDTATQNANTRISEQRLIRFNRESQ
jgi:hypothetical protein